MRGESRSNREGKGTVIHPKDSAQLAIQVHVSDRLPKLSAPPGMI
jgi:hypothetical protein